MDTKLKEKIRSSAEGKPTEFLLKTLEELDSARSALRRNPDMLTAIHGHNLDDALSEAIFQISIILTLDDKGDTCLSYREIEDMI